MTEIDVRRSRFGPIGAFSKRVIRRLLRFVLLPQEEAFRRITAEHARIAEEYARIADESAENQAAMRHQLDLWRDEVIIERRSLRAVDERIAAIIARCDALQRETQPLRIQIDRALRHLADLEFETAETRAGAMAELARALQQVEDLGIRVRDLEGVARGLSELHGETRATAGATDARLSELVPQVESIRDIVIDTRSRLHATPFTAVPLEEWTPTIRSRPGAFDYVGFENIFRGPESMIRARQEVYVPLLRDHSPVLDVGSGRGEFLELLREAGIEAIGVDCNPAMVDHCRKKGLTNVEVGDAIAYLDAARPNSLGAVFSAQFIEHLEPDKLLEFVSLAFERLCDGGTFIAETVNANSIEGAKTFYVDATHVKPLFPETLQFLCKSVGFSEVRVFYPNGSGFDEPNPTNYGEFAVVATV
jgi:2-polyprenyl-3-methyl-5-hydroxy-6-metoxy-1,4-benzoquinol methylase